MSAVARIHQLKGGNKIKESISVKEQEAEVTNVNVKFQEFQVVSAVKSQP